MGLVDDLLRGNEAWAASWSANLPVRPRLGLAVLTCMDARYTAQGVLGLGPGDAHVIRNAGGRLTDDAVRSLTVSATLLNTRRCAIIHHTECGLLNTSNAAIADRVAELSGERPSMEFYPIPALEESVREDVAALRACPYLPEGYEVAGFVYDVRTGELRAVDPS